MKKILILFFLVLLVVGGWFLFDFYQDSFSPNKVLTQKDCSLFGENWVLYNNEEFNIHFCYDGSWGDVELDETQVGVELRNGISHELSFSKQIYGYPMIVFSTLDYELTGNIDVPPMNWDLLDLSMSDDDINSSLFGHYQKLNSSRFEISGYEGYKVKGEFLEVVYGDYLTLVDYLIPGVDLASEQYNIKIIGNYDLEESLDKLVTTFTVR